MNIKELRIYLKLKKEDIKDSLKTNVDYETRIWLTAQRDLITKLLDKIKK